MGVKFPEKYRYVTLEWPLTFDDLNKDESNYNLLQLKLYYTFDNITNRSLTFVVSCAE